MWYLKWIWWWGSRSRLGVPCYFHFQSKCLFGDKCGCCHEPSLSVLIFFVHVDSMLEMDSNVEKQNGTVPLFSIMLSQVQLWLNGDSIMFHQVRWCESCCWLVVWNMTFPFSWELSSKLTFIFFRGVGQPPTKLFNRGFLPMVAMVISGGHRNYETLRRFSRSSKIQLWGHNFLDVNDI